MAAPVVRERGDDARDASGEFEPAHDGVPNDSDGDVSDDQTSNSPTEDIFPCAVRIYAENHVSFGIVVNRVRHLIARFPYTVEYPRSCRVRGLVDHIYGKNRSVAMVLQHLLELWDENFALG